MVDAENQLAPLRAFCERQGYTVAGEYIDWVHFIL